MAAIIDFGFSLNTVGNDFTAVMGSSSWRAGTSRGVCSPTWRGVRRQRDVSSLRWAGRDAIGKRIALGGSGIKPGTRGRRREGLQLQVAAHGRRAARHVFRNDNDFSQLPRAHGRAVSDAAHGKQ